MSGQESSPVNLDIRVNLSGLERAFQRVARAMQGFTMDQRVQARIRVRAVARFQVVHAQAGVTLAKTIKDGRRRHGTVKHRRDTLRALRKAEARWMR